MVKIKVYYKDGTVYQSNVDCIGIEVFSIDEQTPQKQEQEDTHDDV
jgi:hypothetical protein